MCCKYFSKICLDFFLFLLNKAKVSQLSQLYICTAKRILCLVLVDVYLQLEECRKRVIVETSVQFSNGLTLKSYSKIFGRKMAVISEL